MDSYRLLRNNKESGPYSFEELVDLGFKPYDLIWSEGKSAAWRYPSEMSEFKVYAPIVEEQPYDRFFKRPSQQKEISASTVLAKATDTQEITAEKKELPLTLIKEKVFVSLPAKEKIQKPVVKLISVRTEEPQPEKKAIIVPIEIKETKESEEPEIKYSQSLDDMKEMYRETLERRLVEFEKRKKIGSYLRKLPVLLYVFVLGSLIYLTLTAGPKNKPVIPATNSATAITNAGIKVSQPLPVIDTKIVPPFSSTTHTSTDGLEVQEINEKPIKDKAAAPASAGKNSKPNTEQKTTPLAVPASEKQISEKVNPEAGTRNKIARDFAPPDVPINQLVSVATNDYKRGTFGGIKDLELIVNNKSAFLLNTVTVELNYLKPSEEILRTEKISFAGIAPNGSSTIKIPDSPRGVKVNCKVAAIESTAYKQHVAGL